MPNFIQQAIPYSNYLEHLMQSQIIDEYLLNNLVEKSLPENFFDHFANWEQIIHDLNENEFKKQLRHLRTIVFSQILIRDLLCFGSLHEVMHTMTKLADFSLIKAQQLAENQYYLRYGNPIGLSSSTIQHLAIIAMGKMGGYELNASSDIDLIFTFPEDGVTDGKRIINNQEFFSKVTKKVINLIDDITEHGRVFRIDTRLRPNGDSGAIVISEAGLENYLLTQGREWERYAWIKARVVSPYINNIQRLVTPFIYRKYLDFNSFEAMRQLHQQIQEEISSNDFSDNIKLGYGGIREIEFIAQIFQMIRGGQLKELQIKGTRETLNQLNKLQILDYKQTTTLLDAYAFLRNIEHRLQYKNDQQTQKLPKSIQDQNLLAHSMGFQNYSAFLTQLNDHRQNVNDLFNELLHEPDNQSDKPHNDLEGIWKEINNTKKQLDILKKHQITDPEKIILQLQQFKQNPIYEKTRPNVRSLFDKLIPKYIQSISQLNADSTTLTRMLDFSKNIISRSSYLALLNEYPEIIYQLISILSQSKWMSDYLTSHPILLDDLISAQLLDINLDWEQQKQILIRTLSYTKNDVEQQMDIVRKFQHSFIFRFAVQELKGLWAIENLSDQLSMLADIILEQSLKQVWRNYRKAHREVPKFGIIACGKLGGKELTYNSDLDLIYLYNDTHPEANEIYSWFASRLTSFLSAPTSSGHLYQIDLRLRPNGEAGFLATDFDVFKHYQYHHAWTWEHQALTRARFITGDPEIKQKFNQIRNNLLMLNRNKEQLKNEIIEMRSKIVRTHPDNFDNVKYARGGLADVEFIVQYIVLAYSHEYPDLTQNLGNIALLKMAADYQIIDPDLAEKARVAYRNYRKIVHSKVLHDTPPPVNLFELTKDYSNVKQLWDEVFLKNK